VQSTLLRVCAGMLRPHAGRLRVEAPRAFVFQNPDHQVVMPTAGADVAFGLGRLNLPADEVTRRADEALAAVNLQVNPCEPCIHGEADRAHVAHTRHHRLSRALAADKCTRSAVDSGSALRLLVP
jgi:energy-coupling factor transport system ATP-binding protein